MRKLFMVAALSVTVSLGGCAAMAEGALGLPGGFLTKTVQNPVKRSDLYRIENGLIVLISAASKYKALCEARRIADNCVAVVEKMQDYSRKSQPLKRSLRQFVRQNDQVNAWVIFSALRDLIADFRATAEGAGIQIPQQGG